MILRRAVIVAAAAAAVLAGVAAAPAAHAAPATSAQPGPQHTVAQVRAKASIDPQVQRVLQYRPGLQVQAEYRARSDSWAVRVREVGGTRDLARVVLDDTRLAITDRYQLPFDEYPPRLTAREARSLARRDPRVRAAIREQGGNARLRSDVDYEDGNHWEVDYYRIDDKERVVRVRVDVDDATRRVTGVWTGHQVGWKMARGEHEAFGGDINEWFVWWPMFVLFAVLMLEWPLRTWRNLDVVALLSFGISHEFFDHARIDWSVPLAYPPLAYLFVRMAVMFVRGVPAADADRPPRSLAGSVPVMALVVLALFAAGARYGVNVTGSNVIDVGYAGVAGADAILDGKSPYGNMPPDNPHGDTYGPLNYLAYVPAALAFGHELDWVGGLPAAHALSIASDVLCGLALALIGWRFISRRAGAWLVAAWMVFPYTGFALASNVNDLLVAALLLLAFAALPWSWLRGALVAAAAGVKFVPIACVAIVAHAGTRRRLRQSIGVGIGAAAVVAACIAYLASYDDGLRRFADATFGFQYDRDSPFSAWGMYGWRTAQQVLQVLFALALAAAVLVPRTRDFRQVAAGMAAALLGVQLLLQHWFYLYIPWFAGFVLIVIVSQRTSYAVSPSAVSSRSSGARSSTRSADPSSSSSPSASATS